MSKASGAGSTFHPHWDLGLKVSPYRVSFEHTFGGPFFRIDRSGGARTLHLNTSHRFFEQVYDSPTATPEVRAALEIMLFTLGDVILEDDSALEGNNHRVLSWSRRLDLALGMLSEHLEAGDNLDVGQPAWEGDAS
jgi:hypothetical protein